MRALDRSACERALPPPHLPVYSAPCGDAVGAAECRVQLERRARGRQHGGQRRRLQLPLHRRLLESGHGSLAVECVVTTHRRGEQRAVRGGPQPVVRGAPAAGVLTMRWLLQKKGGYIGK